VKSEKGWGTSPHLEDQISLKKGKNRWTEGRHELEPAEPMPKTRSRRAKELKKKNDGRAGADQYRKLDVKGIWEEGKR